MRNLEAAIEKAGITFHAEPAPANPHMDGGMPEGSLHFLCKIKNDTKLPVVELETYYSTGSGNVERWIREHGEPYARRLLKESKPPGQRRSIDEKENYEKAMAYGRKYRPTAADVIGCLLSDFTSIDTTFEDWASDLGYDTDSRKAERAYLLVQGQATKFRRLAGAHYEKLVKAYEEDENR